MAIPITENGLGLKTDGTSEFYQVNNGNFENKGMRYETSGNISAPSSPVYIWHFEKDEPPRNGYMFKDDEGHLFNVNFQGLLFSRMSSLDFTYDNMTNYCFKVETTSSTTVNSVSTPNDSGVTSVPAGTFQVIATFPQLGTLKHCIYNSKPEIPTYLDKPAYVIDLKEV